MSNIARGAPKAQIDEDETELSERADRHSALPQPAEQPVAAGDLNEGSPGGAALFVYFSAIRSDSPHRLARTAHRKASRQKASGKILCRMGRDDAGISAISIDWSACWRAPALRSRSGASAAQGSYSPYDESPAAALARYVRTLASDPKDFEALIGAGKAALELGDAQAAAGSSPAPTTSIRAARCRRPAWARSRSPTAMRRPRCPISSARQQLGAPLSSFACDRGLAYDLLGQQARGAGRLSRRAERSRRRRSAPSPRAEPGDQRRPRRRAADARAADAQGRRGLPRVRAFVLALTGDANGAMTAINAAMPGSWSRVAPFLQRLPALHAGQKAAAVNLGIFPDRQPAYAYNSAATNRRRRPRQLTDRLADLDALLRGSPALAGEPAAGRSARPSRRRLDHLSAYVRAVQRRLPQPARQDLAAARDRIRR